MAKLDKAKLTIRQATHQDIPVLVELSRKVYPQMATLSRQDNPDAQAWVRYFKELGNQLKIKIKNVSE